LANNKYANQKHPKKKRKKDPVEKREREREREPMGVKDLRPKWKRHVVPVGLKSHADPTQHQTLSLSLSLRENLLPFCDLSGSTLLLFWQCICDDGMMMMDAPLFGLSHIEFLLLPIVS
jgi:hypothetical protein